MKLICIMMALAFSSMSFAYNCKKECKAENKQCQILVKESNRELADFHRSLPYDRATLKKKLKDVKAKQKEELNYCKELKKDCNNDCRD